MYRKKAPIKIIDIKQGGKMNTVIFKEFVLLQTDIIIYGYTDNKIKKLENLLKKLGFTPDEIKNGGLYTL